MTLPNWLTFLRIAAVPVLCAAFWLPHPAASWAAFSIFAVASMTDWLDGFLARHLDQTSGLGRCLDPIADKTIVAAALLLLAAFGRMPGAADLAAVVILVREFTVSGLREFLARDSMTLPVTRLAKWKTAAQMTAIATLLVAPALPFPVEAGVAGAVLLWTAAALSAWTGAVYVRAGLARLMPA